MPLGRNFCIVGVGLLGGSIGLALRQRGLADQITGLGRDEQRLAKAAELGAIDRGTTDLADAVSGADLVIVCTPVDKVAGFVSAIAQLDHPCLVTDVGSTKQQMVEQIDQEILKPGGYVRFVGSHPLAGDHRTGVEFARADLFDGRTTVVTPTDSNSPDDVQTIRELWTSLGSRVVELSPVAHDQALAATSHLPHLVSSALAASTTAEQLQLVASGWLDTTRIAAADPGLWREIFAANRQQVLEAAEQFGQNLELLIAALAAGNDQQLEQLLGEGKRIRDAVGN